MTPPEIAIDENNDWIDFCEGHEIPPAEPLDDEEETEELEQCRK